MSGGPNFGMTSGPGQLSGLPRPETWTNKIIIIPITPIITLSHVVPTLSMTVRHIGRCESGDDTRMRSEQGTPSRGIRECLDRLEQKQPQPDHDAGLSWKGKAKSGGWTKRSRADDLIWPAANQHCWGCDWRLRLNSKLTLFARNASTCDTLLFAFTWAWGRYQFF